ncbi:MAG: DMT family transporter [Succinivibrionaceae bacterium]|nr:DMT family transporter [Succinivibrionaceae bacterium]
MFRLRQSLLLFLTATIWGSGFVAQSIGMDYVPPFAFTFVRNLIGTLVLVPLIILMHRIGALREVPRRDLILGSLACGAMLFAAESFQQFGLVTTDVGKAAFITSMYVIFVPVIGLLLGRGLGLRLIPCIGISVLGLYLLCIKEGVEPERGDLQILICAVLFAVHIMVIDHFVARVDGIALSMGQFTVASMLALIATLTTDIGHVTADALWEALPAMAYAGVMSNGIAYTCQVVGQRGMNPAIATLILSLESVMGTILGALVLGESMSGREITGCALVFMAVILAQLPLGKGK